MTDTNAPLDLDVRFGTQVIAVTVCYADGRRVVVEFGVNLGDPVVALDVTDGKWSEPKRLVRFSGDAVRLRAVRGRG